MKNRPNFFASLLVCTLALLSLAPARESSAQKSLAAAPPNFSTLEQEIVAEINLARARPAEYAAFLEQLRPQYAGREFRRPGQPALLTQEGSAALEEAVRFLRAARPLPPLEVSKGMCAGAKLLVDEQSASGATGHKGADGSFCEQRVQRFGAWAEPIGENLTYGDEAARERVINFLIDDGFASRGHRNRLFSASFKVVGVACGGHKLGPMCAITLAGGFTQKSAAGQPAAKTQPGSQPPAGTRRF